MTERASALATEVEELRELLAGARQVEHQCARLEAEIILLTTKLEDSSHALATTSAGLTRHIQRWEALKVWAGKPDTSVDVGAHGLPEVKRIIRELEAQS